MNYYISNLHFGHVHVKQGKQAVGFMRTLDNALNADAPVNGYRPVTFDELLENNKRMVERLNL